MGMNDLGDRSEIAVQQVDDGARGQLLADAAEALDVGKKDRERAAFGLFGTASDQPGDDAWVDKFAEGILDALPRAKLLDHAIKRQREFANFVTREDRQRLRNGTGLDGAGADDQLAQTSDDSRRSHRADAEANAAGEQEQAKAQVGVKPLSGEYIAGCAIRETGEVKADLGKVRSESLSIFGEAKRSRPGILTPAIDKVRHYLLTCSEKPLEAAG